MTMLVRVWQVSVCTCTCVYAVRGQRTTRGATSQALGSGVVHERSARAGIRPVARGSGDPLVCGRRAQQLTFIHSFKEPHPKHIVI